MSDTLKTATEISELLPTFLRHMHPYVFNPIALPPSQVLALVSIQEHNGCTMTQLRKEMHVKAPTITGIVDRLERDGYVKRVADINDRRVTNLILTTKGLKLIDKFRDKIKKRWQYILEHMPTDIGDNVLMAMRRITKGFKDGAM